MQVLWRLNFYMKSLSSGRMEQLHVNVQVHVNVKFQKTKFCKKVTKLTNGVHMYLLIKTNKELFIAKQ